MGTDMEQRPSWGGKPITIGGGDKQATVPIGSFYLVFGALYLFAIVRPRLIAQLNKGVSRHGEP
jgi:hypothetical protein